MMRKYFLLILLVLSITNFAEARLRFLDEGQFKFDFNFNYNTTSSLYDLDGKQKIYDKDTFDIVIDDSIPYRYILKNTFELKEYVFMPKLEYGIAKDFLVFVELPLMWMTYENKYEMDTNRYSPTFGQQVIKADYSSFTPAYYGLGGFIRLNSGIASSAIKFGMQLPQTLKTGYQQDTTDNFYIYNAYKYYLGLISAVNMDKGFFELETTYIYRGGNFGDIFHMKLEAGFTTVENTALKGIFVYDLNLSGYDNAQPVNPRMTTLQEDALDIGASFEAVVADRVFIDFSYLINLGMKNTLQYGKLALKTSVILN